MRRREPKSKPKRFRWGYLLSITAVSVLTLCWAASYGQRSGSTAGPNSPAEGMDANAILFNENEAVLIDVPEKLAGAAWQALDRQIDQAQKQKIPTVIFQFSGRGGPFSKFSELARRINHLQEKYQVRTAAYIPKEAKAMSVLGVIACRTIVADKFAQIGQILPNESKEREQLLEGPMDEQSVITKAESFARAAGHDPLAVRAMIDKKMLLYEIGKESERKLVDQRGFEQLVQQEQTGWRMIGAGPLVGGDEVLLLDGRQAKEIGLVTALAADEEELAAILGVKLVKLAGEVKSAPISMEEKYPGEEKIAAEPNAPARHLWGPQKAVFIVCDEMVDDGMYQAIKRLTQEALDKGATYIIYEIDTYGGRVDSAIEIWNYLINEVSLKAHTVAYVRTKAISAGSLISVACQDIIMKNNTQIGDCAPITMGGSLEGVEREKAESLLRSNFESAAKTNHYPVALCRAMVTQKIEVYQVKNLQTGKYEYFEGDKLPTDENQYDLEDKTMIDTADTLVTLDDQKAKEYGLARTIVSGLDPDAREQVLSFLEKRDGVQFARPVEYEKPNWSEELVRWLSSPTVTGILFMVAMLGIYIELSTPGVGLPGAAAVAALVILFGSKYLIGMANWWEIAVFGVGLVLLMLEIFVIPGFGIAGISGILMIVFALAAMMVQNRPGELPIPQSQVDWQIFINNIFGIALGFVGFLIGVYFFSKYLPHIPVASRLILTAQEEAAIPQGGVVQIEATSAIQAGDRGVSLMPLRPAGKALIAGQRVDVVSQGQLIEANREIIVAVIEGNRIVVKEVS